LSARKKNQRRGIEVGHGGEARNTKSSGSLNHLLGKDVDVTCAPNNGRKTGHPSPKESIQAKKPKHQEMKKGRNGTKDQGQSGI
jgi:hypothetical protein